MNTILIIIVIALALVIAILAILLRNQRTLLYESQEYNRRLILENKNLGCQNVTLSHNYNLLNNMFAFLTQITSDYKFSWSGFEILDKLELGDIKKFRKQIIECYSELINTETCLSIGSYLDVLNGMEKGEKKDYLFASFEKATSGIKIERLARLYVELIIAETCISGQPRLYMSAEKACKNWLLGTFIDDKNKGYAAVSKSMECCLGSDEIGQQQKVIMTGERIKLHRLLFLQDEPEELAEGTEH